MAIPAKQPPKTALHLYNPSHQSMQAVIANNTDFALDNPADVQHLTFEGQQYLVP